ncbi:hypothetical protein [Streptomyces sp. NPDC048438]|uniref:hypothetical protein n=1 Tax=Streptomyces sp. NPDC048438 TaxID=3365551 RepID=UPI00371CDFA0
MYAYEQHDDQHHLDAPVPTVVLGDSASGIGQARQAARAFTGRLTPAPDPDAAINRLPRTTAITRRTAGGKTVTASLPSLTPPQTATPRLQH